MPSLGSDMTSGVLVEQTVAAGEAVRRGDVVGAVETQKGVIEIEIFEDGVLQEWLVDIGTEVPVGAPLAVIGAEGEAASPPPEAMVPAEPTDEQKPAKATPKTAIDEMPRPRVVRAPKEAGARQRITPAARRLAAEKGIDLGTVSAPPDQIIGRRMIEALVGGAKEATAPKPQDDMRAAIAAAMTRSKREIPHYYLRHEIDLTTAEDFLSSHNAGRPPEERLLLGALYARAIALSLAKYPEFNGHYGEAGFQPSGAVHVGVAIHIRSGGLVAPAVFDVDKRDLGAIMGDLSDLVARVRRGRFKARELSDATITLTSLGDRGVDEVIGVIYPPQVAIVGVGTPRKRPAVVDDTVMPRTIATLSLAADHRVSDGHRGALFLRSIDARMQEPDTL